MTVSMMKLNFGAVPWRSPLGHFAKLHLGVLTWGVPRVLSKDNFLQCFLVSSHMVLQKAHLGCLIEIHVGCFPEKLLGCFMKLLYGYILNPQGGTSQSFSMVLA